MTRTPRSRNLPLPAENVRAVGDGVYSEVSVPSSRLVRKTPKIKEIPRIVSDGIAEITIPTQDTIPPPLDSTRAPQIPTYPAIPPLQSSNATDGPRQAHGLTMSRRKPLPKSSTVKLSPVAEHKSSTYELTAPTGTRDAEPVEIAKTDDLEDSTISGLLSVPKQDRYSRTSTMSSAISAKSHEGPGAIYIRPSAQLESMQCISELDKKLRSAAKCRNGWQTMGRKNDGVHTPTGTPESISNIPLNAQVYRAHSRLNHTIQNIPDVTDRVSMQDWAKSSEWIEPCSTAPGPTEWIEDFLTRREQADRAEENKKRKQKRENGILRGNSLNNFVRRLSGKKVVGKRKSFETRRGNIEEVVRMPERTRALSWDVVPEQAMAAQDAPPDRSSPKQALSPPPRLCAENRSHTSPAMLYRSPTFHEPVAAAFTLHHAAATTTHTMDNTYQSPPQPSSSSPQRPQPPPLPRLPSFSPSPHRHRHRNRLQQQRHNQDTQNTHTNTNTNNKINNANKTNTTNSIPLRTKSFSKSRFKSMSSSMGTGVKRSLSVSMAPAFVEGRHSVQGLMGRMGKKIEDGFRGLGGKIGVEAKVTRQSDRRRLLD
ncbi:hypothetical protein DDE82_006950 [Stemphylium lycopersici]|nr:hypothetical protein DDE82_006950 [Stemphylium lycopersici]